MKKISQLLTMPYSLILGAGIGLIVGLLVNNIPLALALGAGLGLAVSITTGNFKK